jgi:hypothetical protein
MGIFAVAHLAARHGIDVLLTQPPGGGTSVEVRLPAELISSDGRPDNGADELEAEHDHGAGTAAVAADPRSSAPGITAGPDAADDTADAASAGVPRPDVPADLAPTLGAPVPAPPPAEYAADDRDA